MYFFQQSQRIATSAHYYPLGTSSGMTPTDLVVAVVALPIIVGLFTYVLRGIR